MRNFAMPADSCASGKVVSSGSFLEKDWFDSKWADRHYAARDWFSLNWVEKQKHFGS